MDIFYPTTVSDAGIQSLIDDYSKNNDIDTEEDQTQQKSRGKRTQTKKKKKKPKQKHVLDRLRERVTELMAVFEENGLFLPPPESLSEKGKVWSSRIYGADKKRQRKHCERQLVEDRIQQLSKCLKEQHGITAS
jgi:hypothetical protein